MFSERKVFVVSWDWWLDEFVEIQAFMVDEKTLKS